VSVATGTCIARSFVDQAGDAVSPGAGSFVADGGDEAAEGVSPPEHAATDAIATATAIHPLTCRNTGTR
jgi:hypothetical protein